MLYNNGSLTVEAVGQSPQEAVKISTSRGTFYLSDQEWADLRDFCFTARLSALAEVVVARRAR